MTSAAEDWVPGIPLHDPDRHPNSRYLFNWRDFSETEQCHCADSASWPNPSGLNHDLTRIPDEVERFIRDCRTEEETP